MHWLETEIGRNRLFRISLSAMLSGLQLVTILWPFFLYMVTGGKDSLELLRGKRRGEININIKNEDIKLGHNTSPSQFGGLRRVAPQGL